MEMTERVKTLVPPLYTPLVCFVDDDDLVAPHRNEGYLMEFYLARADPSFPQYDVITHPFTPIRYACVCESTDLNAQPRTVEDVDVAIFENRVSVRTSDEEYIRKHTVAKMPLEIHTTCVQLKALEAFFKSQAHMVDNRFCDQHFLWWLFEEPKAGVVFVRPWEEWRQWAYFYRKTLTYPHTTLVNVTFETMEEAAQYIIDGSQVKNISRDDLKSVFTSMQIVANEAAKSRGMPEMPIVRNASMDDCVFMARLWLEMFKEAKR
jgi:hypothetical protein